MNYYKILGIPKNACKKAIREAYLKKVKLYHPDLNKSPDASTKFKQIQEAYQALYNNVYTNNFSANGNQNYSSSHKSDNIKKDQQYYTDDFSDFHKAFYEEVRKMREHDRNEQHRRYANTDYHSFNYVFNKYPREFFYINLIFKLFPLFFVPTLFFYVIYKQYILRNHFKEIPLIVYDSYGRAFLVDVHGNKFRASEFDKF